MARIFGLLSAACLIAAIIFIILVLIGAIDLPERNDQTGSGWEDGVVRTPDGGPTGGDDGVLDEIGEPTPARRYQDPLSCRAVCTGGEVALPLLLVSWPADSSALQNNESLGVSLDALGFAENNFLHYELNEVRSAVDNPCFDESGYFDELTAAGIAECGARLRPSSPLQRETPIQPGADASWGLRILGKRPGGTELAPRENVYIGGVRQNTAYFIGFIDQANYGAGVKERRICQLTTCRNEPGED